MNKKRCSNCGEEFWPRNKGQTAHASCTRGLTFQQTPLPEPDPVYVAREPHKRTQKSVKIVVIPDTQTKPGVNTDHLQHIGEYIADKRPDIIIHVGDHWDMPSLSSYDVGKRQAEGRRVMADMDAGKRAMDRLMNPIAAANGYNPKKHFLMGNHEYRLQRAIDADAKLDGLISMDDYGVEAWGWEPHAFLEVLTINGCDFSHYFTSGPMGRPVSSPAVLLRERQKSAVQGHVQRFDMAVHQKTGQMALFVGIAYTHYEEYLGPQGNGCRQQIVVMHDLHDGIFDPMFVSLSFLEKRFKGEKK